MKTDKRMPIAVRIARLVNQTESSLDAALTEAATLTAALTSARTEAGLPAAAGHIALDRVGKTLAALMEARRQLVAGHAQLDRTREQMGLPELSFGDVSPKPAFTEGLLEDVAQAA